MLSPLTWLLAGMVLACVGLRLAKRGRWLVPLGVAVMAVAVFAMTPLLANTLVRWLESPRPAAASCDSAPPAVAVVLAGGMDEPVDAVDISALAITSRRRVERAVAWSQEAPGRRLVMSGGSRRAGGVPAAALMAAYASRLGVAAREVRVEDGSLSTRENARALASLQPALPRRLVLITSAMHMPRARHALEAAGFQVCPLAADSAFVPFGLPGYLIPGSHALRKTEVALHELVGLAYYRWLDAREQ